MSALLPEGITSLSDAPYNLVDAITMGLAFLTFEQHDPKDRPRKRIWQDPERMKAHWDAVKRRHKEGRSDEVEDPIENAAAEGLIVGR